MDYTQLSFTHFEVLWPSVILAAGGLAALLLEVSGPRLRGLAGALSLVALVASAVALYGAGTTTVSPAESPLATEVGTDLLALAFAPAFYLSALAALLLGGPYLRRNGFQRAEFQALVLFSTAGMVLLVQARDLLMLFLALETLSIPIYVLAGFFTDRERSIESALKYFTTGAFSSAFVAFGTALTYGAAGTLDFAGVQQAVAALAAEGGDRLLLAHGGLAFLLVGFGFKIAMVPFHAWAGDVYQGAPTPVTAFLSVGSKAAGFAGLLRLLVAVFPSLPGWVPVLSVLAALSLILGNTVAALQEDLKRLIAYSGISHAGFLLMGAVAHQRLTGGRPVAADLSDLSAHPALVAVVFYLVAYALMTLGALTVVLLVEGDYNETTRLVDYAGLAHRRPALAGAMLLFLLSLGGMPPLAGFVGKWLVFTAAVSAGLIPLAVVAALASVVGFYYYLRVVRQMYLQPEREGAAPVAGALLPARAAWLVGFALAGTVLLGLWPAAVLDLLP
jgi:NADH-quinone oxidoreductase subunit N